MIRRVDRSERGATLVLFVILLLSMLGAVALVLDLAALRQDRRADRNASDAAVAAGASAMGTGTLLDGCEAAWTSAVRSLDEPTTSSPCAAVFGTVASCTASTPALTATKAIGDYTISIVAPVPQNHDLMDAETPGRNTAQAFDSNHDGSDKCTRLGVTISLRREPYFAQALGVSGRTTEVHSVARYVIEFRPGSNIPALVALKPNVCAAINAGTGTIHARPPVPTVDVPNPGPGIIRTDSSRNNCPDNNTVMRVQTDASGLIQADSLSGPGLGQLVNFATSGVFRAGATSGPTTGYYGQRVTTADQITRNPFDLVYRCTIATTTTGATCPNGQTDVYNTVIAPLLSGVPATHNGAVATYSTISGAACNVPPIAPLIGNWYINCTNWSHPTQFLGSGTVVFEGGVNIQTITMTFNCLLASSCTTDKNVIIRGNGASPNLSLQATGALFNAPRTFVYHARGNLTMQGGPTLNWSAPRAVTWPTRHLLYWSESTSNRVEIQGDPVINSSGIFFIPNSTIAIIGNANVDADLVQFWTGDVDVQGNGRFFLRPDPGAALPTDAARAILIR